MEAVSEASRVARWYVETIGADVWSTMSFCIGHSVNRALGFFAAEENAYRYSYRGPQVCQRFGQHFCA